MGRIIAHQTDRENGDRGDEPEEENRVQAAALLVLALVMVWMTGANATRRKAKLQKVEWNYCDPEAARTSNITAVGMHPYPPRAGDKVKLLVAGKHGETVNGGL